MTALVSLFARCVPWQEQRCDRCGAVEPIDHLLPVVTNGVLTGWVCEAGNCDE